MSKRNLILVAVLVVQIAIAAVVFWPREVASRGEPLFPAVEAGQIVGLTITGAGDNRIVLAKAGEGWVLSEAGDYPVLADKVPPLLADIAGLTTDRLVAQTPGSHGRLKVARDDFERRIEFEMADGTVRQLYVGTAPSFGATHVRAGGRDEVYLTADLTAQEVQVQASAWVDRTYLEVPQDQIVAVTLENANGRFEFVKAGETWTMAGLAADEPLDEGAVNTLVNRARLTTLQAPLGKEELPAYGLDDPQAVVTLQTETEQGGSRTYTLWVGAQDPEDNSYVVKSSESAWYVRVNEFAVSDFVEKGRQDFIVQPTPTPEALPEATPVGP